MNVTTFDVCKHVRSAVLRRAGEAMAYHKSWGADFCVKEMVDLRGELESHSDWFKPINLNDLTSQELDELGFGTWSDDLPIRLIPIWLLPFLREEIEAQSIFGEQIKSVSLMDNEHRFGCIAYGVTPKPKGEPV